MGKSLSESFEDTFNGKCKNGGDSSRSKLVKALESVLPGDNNFISGGSGQRINVTNQDLFEIYIRVCELKGEDPEWLYSKGRVVSRGLVKEVQDSDDRSLEDVWKGLG